MVSHLNFSQITPDRIALKSEKSKSGKDQVKLYDVKTDWHLTVECAPMQIMFENLSGDGTLGLFGITDPRQANYATTLVTNSTPSQLAGSEFASYLKKSFAAQEVNIDFLRGTCEKTFLWLAENGKLKSKVAEATKMAKKLFGKDAAKVKEYVDEVIISGGTMPFGEDKETGDPTLKLKKRLCKWAPEGEEAERDQVDVYAYDRPTSSFVRHEEPLERGDWVQPTTQLSVWVTAAGIYGVTCNIKSFQLIKKGPGARTKETPMSVPDIPVEFAEPAIKRAKTEQ